MALEQRVQALLFHRTTRTVRLTDTGRVFFERCERIAKDRDEAIALIGERSEPQGELRVTCSTAMGERFVRSEEHTSELQSLMRISYAVFCLKKKILQIKNAHIRTLLPASKIMYYTTLIREHALYT